MESTGRYFFISLFILTFVLNNAQSTVSSAHFSSKPTLANVIVKTSESEFKYESKLAPLVEIARLDKKHVNKPVKYYDNGTETADNIVLAEVGEEYELKCISSSRPSVDDKGQGDLLQWEVETRAKDPNSTRTAYSVRMQRTVENVLDPSTYSFQLTLFVKAVDAEGGVTFTCHYLNNPRIFTRVHIFIVNASISSAEGLNNMDLTKIEGSTSVLDPNSRGKGKETDDVFELRFPAHNPSVSCWHERIGANDLAIEFKSVRCDNAYDCHIWQQCLHNSCPFRELLGQPCNTGPCSVIFQSHFTAMASCSAARKTMVHQYFLGLDSRRYTIEEGKIPTKALIKMESLNASICYTDEPAWFFCEASSFLFAEGLQFTVKLTNGTIIPLPQEDHKLIEVNEEPDNPFSHKVNMVRVQRGLQINLTEEMVEVNCLAPWFNSTTEWLVASSGRFQVRAPKEPHIVNKEGMKAGSTRQSLQIGRMDQTLTCRAEAQPPATFKWLHKGKEIVQSDPKYHIVQSRRNGESILKFQPMNSTSNATCSCITAKAMRGKYECVATNRLGNDTIDFFVTSVQFVSSSVSSVHFSVCSIFYCLSFYCVVLFVVQ